MLSRGPFINPVRVIYLVQTAPPTPPFPRVKCSISGMKCTLLARFVFLAHFVFRFFFSCVIHWTTHTLHSDTESNHAHLHVQWRCLITTGKTLKVSLQPASGPNARECEWINLNNLSHSIYAGIMKTHCRRRCHLQWRGSRSENLHNSSSSSAV